MMINGGLAVLGLAADLSPILAAFWGGEGLGGQSVAVLATGDGRLSGVFNQPVEAGAAYCLALFAAVHLLSRPERGRDRPVVLALVVLPILVGGVLCVSKIFLLCGLARWNGTWMLQMLIPGAGSRGLFAQYTADGFRPTGSGRLVPQRGPGTSSSTPGPGSATAPAASPSLTTGPGGGHHRRRSARRRPADGRPAARGQHLVAQCRCRP
ncbi:hypothetical protein E7Y31_18590 [Candidatus Frankia alpina]|uniref:Uncharacterized protein n=1 Tax=Candidatus Frankia alpina TaxID=2699483 RepID=A0A4S5D1U2_9ACTN|nr:hypothetical protein E7Y31_18590 [Candidatus Frankia alpina]